VKRALAATIALVLAPLLAASSAAAQEVEVADPSSEAAILDGRTEPPTLPAPPGELPSRYRLSRWAHEPGGPEGILDPVLVTHPDYGLMVAGGIMATIAYVLGSSLSMFFGAVVGCWAPDCEPALGALGLIPLGEWSAGFSGSFVGSIAFISGGVLAAIELAGLMILLAGATHHHPELVPRELMRRRSGREDRPQDPEEER
jgi:hypothetical protein